MLDGGPAMPVSVTGPAEGYTLNAMAIAQEGPLYREHKVEILVNGPGNTIILFVYALYTRVIVRKFVMCIIVAYNDAIVYIPPLSLRLFLPELRTSRSAP
jgi:hypothetical protein